jgi:predicted dehydrogenase
MGVSSGVLRFGVIGFRMGWTHASKLIGLEDATLSAVAEMNEAAREEAEQFGARYYRDYRQMLEQETLDAAIVAVPHHLLSEIGCACLERGLHVLVEKPMAHTLEAADRLVAAAARAGRQLAVGYQWRFHPQTQKVRAMLAAGELGRVSLAHSFWVGYSPDEYFDMPWKGERENGGGPTLLVASHVVDTFRYLLGEVVQSGALFDKSRGRDVEDSAVITLRFAGGALATLVISTAAINAPGPARTFTLMGDRASVSYPPLTKAWYPWFTPHCYYREREQGIPPTTRDIPVPGADPHVEQLRNLCAAIRGEADLIASGAEARRTLAVLMNIVQAGDASMTGQG